MFGMGFTEILVILVLALIIIGPRKFPEMAKTLGRGLAEFRRTSDEIRGTLNDSISDVARDAFVNDFEEANKQPESPDSAPNDTSDDTPNDEPPEDEPSEDELSEEDKTF